MQGATTCLPAGNRPVSTSNPTDQSLYGETCANRCAEELDTKWSFFWYDDPDPLIAVGHCRCSNDGPDLSTFAPGRLWGECENAVAYSAFLTQSNYLFDACFAEKSELAPNTSPSGWAKRQHRQRMRREQYKLSVELCPSGLTACRVGGGSDVLAYECVDIESELESCGGCVNGAYTLSHTANPKSNVTSVVGTDCTTLPGVWPGGVTCLKGHCLAFACSEEDGFHLVNDACARHQDV
ncbi:hypothetical protein IAU59_001667 [Kwoniella sp. CBS 9459]